MDNKIEDDKRYILGADAWLRDIGFISDFHKNELIINTLLRASRADNVEFKIDTHKLSVTVFLYYSRLNLFFTRKKKLIDDLMYYYKKLFPMYSFRIEFII